MSIKVISGEGHEDYEEWTCDTCGYQITLQGVGGDVAECPMCIAEDCREEAEYEAQKEAEQEFLRAHQMSVEEDHKVTLERQHQVSNAIDTLTTIAAEIKKAWVMWDEHIKAGQQPVPIQDLDYWQDQIARAAKVLEGD